MRRRRSREEWQEMTARANEIVEQHYAAQRQTRTVARRQFTGMVANTGVAIPKSPRIIDPEALQRYREAHPGCEYPGGDCEHSGWPIRGGTHHIRKRSAGGGDVPENLINLCNKHHSLAHDGTITTERLIEIKKQGN